MELRSRTHVYEGRRAYSNAIMADLLQRPHRRPLRRRRRSRAPQAPTCGSDPARRTRRRIPSPRSRWRGAGRTDDHYCLTAAARRAMAKATRRSPGGASFRYVCAGGPATSPASERPVVLRQGATATSEVLAIAIAHATSVYPRRLRSFSRVPASGLRFGDNPITRAGRGPRPLVADLSA